MLKSEIEKLLNLARPKLKFEWIVFLTPWFKRKKMILAERMPYPFDGWYHRNGRFYVPAKYDSKLKQTIFRRAKYEKALLELEVFHSKLLELSIGT